MDYRREIDGLRALAILPVILHHAGLNTFNGGFIGVDIFFVISGYLITAIILKELENDRFSIVHFYERRARRILPALFVVMLSSLLAGYFLLMPDEFKNLGQSVVATAFFSNNILLALTSGYWDLASEFKPLLHTWSLGVEEQYYAVVPVLLVIFARLGRHAIPLLLWGIFILSFALANWLGHFSPKWAFYILPTRAWEIGIGALVALYVKDRPPSGRESTLSNALSLIGLLLILTAIFTFNESITPSGWPLLMPTLGAALIIAFCGKNSLTYSVLGSGSFVFIGLISFSLYLWHQPFFSYLRARSVSEPKPLDFIQLLPFVILLSILTWKYIESPFRDREIVGSKHIAIFSMLSSLVFITAGLFLDRSYGMPNRVFSNEISISDMDKRTYNERVFSYKQDNFSNLPMTNVLIIGNSFARDFTNITLENFDVSQAEIVYRNDLEQCINSPANDARGQLYEDADVIVFASGNYAEKCISSDIAFAEGRGKAIFYVGTKDFGYNLNWIILLEKDARANQYNAIPSLTTELEKRMASIIPAENFISLLKPTLVEGKIPITDEFGRMLSTDRAHLTKYGAIFFGQKAVAGSHYANFFK